MWILDLGTRNGEAILREVEKVRRGAGLYVVSTHFHPEHALGEGAFPSTAEILRARARQDDIDEFGLSAANAFASRSPAMAELLEGVEFRVADQVFDREITVDLGGVEVRSFWLGPTHTRGDTLVYVEGDGVLFSGDVVMDGYFPGFNSPYSDLQVWIDTLEQLELLQPVRIVPSHGAMGDASLIESNRTYLIQIQSRVAELRGQGRSAEEAGETLTTEFQSMYPNWRNGGGPNAIARAVAAVYAEAD